MTGDIFLQGGRMPGHEGAFDVLMADGRIRAIVPSGIVSTPARSRVLALDGRFFVPGLWDNHVHFTQWAAQGRRHDFSSSTSSAADVLSRVASIVGSGADTGAGTGAGVGAGGVPSVPGGATQAPLIGFGLRDGLWDSTLDRFGLDAVAGGRQVILISGDLHCCWLNSAALAHFGFDGHPTGLLREDDCFQVTGLVNDLSAEAGDELAAEAARVAASRGVVGIVDLEMADNLAVWRRRIGAGQRDLRVAAGIYATHLDQAIEARLRTGDIMPKTGGLLSVGPFKVVTDGSLNTRTAYCYDEYPGLEGQEGSRGMLTVAPDDLLALLERATAAGLVPAVHAIGDHANALALGVFEHLGTGGRIEHAQLVADADFSRFAASGVTASVQPEHAMDDRDVADHFWVGRTDRAFALASLRASGAALLLGSDAPVAPLDPWVTMAAAVGRSRDQRPPWHPEQRIAAVDALAASANGTAIIGVGMPADLVVTDLDPLFCDPDELRRMPVSATFLAGRPTYLAPWAAALA
ncbi:amidohydrolase [Subtercola boreus]|uniref:amidohydrolase n=1 Tax=Subtercola boreus TaxID=120213 RepID=UPI00209BF2A3|nr:amidohydrolase family protein [Subtercola boreus]